MIYIGTVFSAITIKINRLIRENNDSLQDITDIYDFFNSIYTPFEQEINAPPHQAIINNRNGEPIDSGVESEYEFEED